MLKNSSLRDRALEIQAETGVKYTKALREASKELYFFDEWIRDEWDSPYDTDVFGDLTTELIDVLPNIQRLEPLDGKSPYWTLSKTQDGNIHLSPKGGGVCHCTDVITYNGNEGKPLTTYRKDGVSVAPSLHQVEYDEPSYEAYAGQMRMENLKNSTQVVIYFESSWDGRCYVLDIEGLSLDAKKAALVEFLNVQMRPMVSNHIERCEFETERADG